MDSPLISVIIPTYNRLAFLKEAVASVLKQTYKNIELIIADDGSTDETAAYCRNKGIRRIPLAHTGLPGLTRNRGVSASSGEYIAFLDSDDTWQKDKIARQIEFFTANPEIRICHTREVWNRLGKIISQKGQKHKRAGDIFSDALVKCIIGPSTVMLHKSLWDETGGFNETIEIAEDYELWLRITAGNPVGYIESPLTVKQGGHEDQLSEKYGHIEYFRIEALRHNIDRDSFREARLKEALEVLIKKMEIYTEGCLKRQKNAEAEHFRELTCSYKKKLL